MSYVEAIAQVVSERTGYKAEDITADHTFAELGIDSLDTVELMMALEDVLGFEIELDQAVRTVGELDAFLQGIQG